MAALLLIVTVIGAHASDAPTRIAWQKAPIPIVLTVGEERLLHFPAPVTVGLPSVLEPVLRTQSVNGTVYLRASSPFAAQRVLVRELDGGQVYLIDLSAETDGGGTSPVTIYREVSRANESDRADNEPDGRHGYVSLTRFAARQLYAPTRLLLSGTGVVRVPVQRRAVPLIRGGTVSAVPLASWRSGDLYVTAVKLENRSSQAHTLDPRTLRGAWLTATFQHARLLPQGDEADTTAAYLVSALPFDSVW
jgi:integrating conjugative element protein (TIGR03749 family)